MAKKNYDVLLDFWCGEKNQSKYYQIAFDNGKAFEREVIKGEYTPFKEVSRKRAIELMKMQGLDFSKSGFRKGQIIDQLYFCCE